VSGGELKVSRQVGLPFPKPKNGLPLFWAAFSRLLSCRHGGATGFLLLLRVHGLPGVLVLLVVCDLFDYALPPAYFLRTATVMGRKQTTERSR
jgi:hypothetical protein